MCLRSYVGLFATLCTAAGLAPLLMKFSKEEYLFIITVVDLSG